MTRDEAREQLREADWLAVAEDVGDGLPVDVILKRLRGADAGNSDAAAIVAQIDDAAAVGGDTQVYVVTLDEDEPVVFADGDQADEYAGTFDISPGVFRLTVCDVTTGRKMIDQRKDDD